MDSTNLKRLPQQNFIKLPNEITILLLTLFFSVHSLYAQNEKELSDFLHSGTVKTKVASVKVPIVIWNDLILLKVKVNGNDATFMWDNGFSYSGIDNSLVQPYKLVPFKKDSETIMIDGNNAEIKNIDFLMCPQFEMKGIKITNTPFVKLDFRTFTISKDLKIEGAIGSSIINKLNWKFYFDNNYVEISEKPFNINNDDLVLPFKIKDNNTHSMAITFDDNTTECAIDFGYNSDVISINTINAKLFFKANATKTFGPASISLSGVAPQDTIYTIKDNFTWELSGKKLKVKPKISFTKSTENVVVGNKLFRSSYNVVINTSSDTVYALSPRKKAAVKKNDNAYGYKLYNVNGIFQIMSIECNANTVDSDIKLFDEVISINGKVAADFEDNFTLREYQKELLDKQKEMILKFKDGKEISLTPQPPIEYEFKNEKELW